ncbi:hypothetical protein NCAS_0A13110 [Naumovozyma castellii]|uniref:Uncharacterized protein n=1 Tax=Naumovozyma castellii TaxID=27288 RepID=G0V8S0_NAUCA|nr:hypothetical protein NCAS_0A13110 [Naumovozyma castellii CBS 4309]CCC67869.1 hypothetical protein NCAS_0A13110 [Naumovozyma castellii CBS 4309]
MTVEEKDIPELTTASFRETFLMLQDGEKAMEELENKVDQMEKNMESLLAQIEKMEQENNTKDTNDTKE